MRGLRYIAVDGRCALVSQYTIAGKAGLPTTTVSRRRPRQSRDQEGECLDGWIIDVGRHGEGLRARVARRTMAGMVSCGRTEGRDMTKGSHGAGDVGAGSATRVCYPSPGTAAMQR